MSKDEISEITLFFRNIDIEYQCSLSINTDRRGMPNIAHFRSLEQYIVKYVKHALVVYVKVMHQLNNAQLQNKFFFQFNLIC